jgi:hypothetical protein
MDLAADAAYSIEVSEGLTTEAWFGAETMISDMNLYVGLGVYYQMSEVVELHAEYDIEQLAEVADTMVFNVGSDLSIDSMTYEIDYTLDMNEGGADATTHTVSFLATASF